MKRLDFDNEDSSVDTPTPRRACVSGEGCGKEGEGCGQQERVAASSLAEEEGLSDSTLVSSSQDSSSKCGGGGKGVGSLTRGGVAGDGVDSASDKHVVVSVPDSTSPDHAPPPLPPVTETSENPKGGGSNHPHSATPSTLDAQSGGGGGRGKELRVRSSSASAAVRRVSVESGLTPPQHNRLLNEKKRRRWSLNTPNHLNNLPQVRNASHEVVW